MVKSKIKLKNISYLVVFNTSTDICNGPQSTDPILILIFNKSDHDLFFLYGVYLLHLCLSEMDPPFIDPILFMVRSRGGGDRVFSREVRMTLCEIRSAHAIFNQQF